VPKKILFEEQKKQCYSQQLWNLKFYIKLPTNRDKSKVNIYTNKATIFVLCKKGRGSSWEVRNQRRKSIGCKSNANWKSNWKWKCNWNACGI